MNHRISHLKGREIIDSRGQPTLEVEVFLENNLMACASIPSGASTGKHEARELRDGKKNYFFKKGVKKAIENVSLISSKLKGMDVTNQKQIDARLLDLDGTPLKDHLGANTLLGVSLACLRAAAQVTKKPLYAYLWATFVEDWHIESGIVEDFRKYLGKDPPKDPLYDRWPILPVPLINVINGGVHAQNNLQIQEFMIVPFDFQTFREALRAACEIFYQLKKDLQSKGLSTNVGDEGGFAPQFSHHNQAMDCLLSSIEKCGYSGRVGLALDCAASEFYKEGFYHFEGKKQNAEDLIALYESWAKSYPLLSIEDGLAEDDWGAWKILTEKLGNKIQIVGDDLFVTQTQRLNKGIREGIANSLLVKCNQVGTVSETYKAVETALRAGYACVMSHRSGETEDTFISDLAVGWGCGQIKTGSVCRGERTAKYNRLLRIEEELGEEGIFYGKRAFSRIKK